MVMIILFFGGITWAYFHFVQDRYLQHPFKYVTVETDYKTEMHDNYRNRMRKDTKGRMDLITKELQDFLSDTKSGKYGEDKEGFGKFKQRYYEEMNELRTIAGEVNVRTVPKPFEAPHKAYCDALHDYYNSMLSLYESQASDEPSVREAKFKDAVVNFKKGKGLYEQARALFEVRRR
ncbi:MAG: hypothetical protein HY319_20785 [Armatimonadetes bacterium]|nr:hypothetical protein [Armatimonadota bacterium]